MILTYKQIQAIDLQVELQRGQAVINMDYEAAADIGSQVDINPHPSRPLVVTVEVSGGKTFNVDAKGEVV